MPAKGVPCRPQRSRSEPHHRHAASPWTASRACSAASACSTASTCRFRVADGLGIVGRSGAGKSTLLSLVAGLDEPDAGSIAVGGETTAAGRLARCALMPQRDCLLPWRSALDNACLALENRGVPRARGAPPGRAAVRAARARRLRAAAAGAALRRDAPAGRLPAHAARRQGRAAPRRAVRRARRDHARRAAGVARATCSPPSRARCCSSRTTSRRRCSSATRVAVLAGRPDHRRARRRRAARPPAARGRDRPGVRRVARARARGDRVRRVRGRRSRLLAGAVGVWELVVRAAHVPDYLFPAPTAVAASLDHDCGLLARATLVTLREVAPRLPARGRGRARGRRRSSTSRRRCAARCCRSSCSRRPCRRCCSRPILAILLGYGLDAEARRRRRRLLLPDRRQRGRRPALGRPASSCG